MTVDEIYERHIKKLPRKERLRLLALTAEGLAEPATHARKRRHSVKELAGLGREMWRSVDAQQYVDSARDEWEERPA